MLKPLEERLVETLRAPDPIAEMDLVVEALKKDGPELASVSTILRFMENHPTIDFGMPGPLVHFVEGFFGHGYETELIDSLNRRPTVHTVWMLNRIINGTKSPTVRARLANVLRAAAVHPEADRTTCERAEHFLSRLR